MKALVFALVFVGVLCWVPPASAQTQALDVPANGQQYSGIGTVHGWICEPRGELTVQFDGGEIFPLPYGMRRKDVLAAGLCDHDRVGFVVAWNWSDLSDGEHIAVVHDDGVPIFRRTFTVATFGVPFLRDAFGSCLVDHFPGPGDIARFIWNQGMQRLELDEIVRETDE